MVRWLTKRAFSVYKKNIEYCVDIKKVYLCGVVLPYSAGNEDCQR
jgi:hypothetical protein